MWGLGSSVQGLGFRAWGLGMLGTRRMISEVTKRRRLQGFVLTFLLTETVLAMQTRSPNNRAMLADNEGVSCKTLHNELPADEGGYKSNGCYQQTMVYPGKKTVEKEGIRQNFVLTLRVQVSTQSVLRFP